MYFTSQQEYERYYSPEQQQIRTEQARNVTEAVVADAHRCFTAGDIEAARQILFDAGIQDDGIAFYLSSWR